MKLNYYSSSRFSKSGDTFPACKSVAFSFWGCSLGFRLRKGSNHPPRFSLEFVSIFICKKTSIFRTLSKTVNWSVSETYKWKKTVFLTEITHLTVLDGIRKTSFWPEVLEFLESLMYIIYVLFLSAKIIFYVWTKFNVLKANDYLIS